MTDDAGAGRPAITAVGAYAPRFRIDADEFAEAWGRFEASGIREKALANADEDALTMAREAAVRALSAGDVSGDAVDFLAFGTTTPPLEESDLTARLGTMLGIPENATCHTFGNSTRAGTRALGTALDVNPETGLVVVADCPEGAPDAERGHAAGAGAAAFLLTGDASTDDRAGAEIVTRAEHTTPYPGTRFRRRGSDEIEELGVTSYDRAAFIEPLSAAVENLDAGLGSVDAAAVQAPDGALPYRAAGALGVDSETIQAAATVHELGDTGAASVPLGIVTALAEGHETVLAAAWGGGAGADALLIERRGEVHADLALDDGEAVSYPEYLRRRGVITSGPPDGGGAYVSVPSWRRTLPQRYRLVAGRCPACEALEFPPEGACSDCGAFEEYEPVELPGTGIVEAVTTISQGGAPPEFADQQARSGDFGVAVVAFDGPDGDTVSVPAQVVDGHDLAVGDRVDATVRRIYTQEGVTRYGFKIRPLGGF